MKKNAISMLIFTVFLSNMCICQTVEKEKAYIFKEYSKGDITIYDYQKRGKVWRELKTEVGYPLMPFNQDSTDVYYGYVIQFDSLNKTIIYRRLEEWLALRYGNLNYVLDYRDSVMGKIIFKNTIRINTPKFDNKDYINPVNCTSENRFTVKDNKLRVEFFQISYDLDYNSIYSALGNYPIMSYFPICKTDVELWKQKAYVLKQTSVEFENLVNSLNDFIADYKNDYIF